MNRNELTAEIPNGTVKITRNGCGKCDRGVETLTIDTVIGNSVNVQTITGPVAELIWRELEASVLCRSSSLWRM